jgi:hypothetical protein
MRRTSESFVDLLPLEEKFGFCGVAVTGTPVCGLGDDSLGEYR